MLDLKNLIFELCKSVGVSGNEEAVISIAAKELKKYCKEVTYKNKSLIATMGPLRNTKNIMLDAHIDQIGFIVTNIDKAGFIKVAACGGIDSRIILGSVVKIHGKQDIMGIVCCVPPHLNNSKNEKVLKVEDLFIDTGMKAEEVKEIISIGDNVSFYNEPKSLLQNRITSPSLDNRAGVAALIKCAEFLSYKELPCKVTIVLSAQEETTTLGATTASYNLYPDEALIVDVSFADQPTIPLEKTGKMSQGPMIGIAPSISKNILDKLISLAKSNNIPYQLEIMGGKTGTNCDEICKTKSGIPCGMLSIPLRYMHTPVETVDLCDIENTAKLLAKYVEAGGLIND